MILTLFAASLALFACQSAGQDLPKSLYDLKVKDIDGKDVSLSKFKGKALMIVNVASKCGMTPQYKALEELYKENKDKGLVILGFPANNFGNQEPGSNEEIKEFCSLNYGVSFPMFTKVSVKGDDQAPLYRWLVSKSDRPKDDIEWNFAKFVVGRDGKVIARFKPNETPESEPVRAAVGTALASKP